MNSPRFSLKPLRNLAQFNINKPARFVLMQLENVMLLNIHEPARYVLMQLENVTQLNIHEPAPLHSERARCLLPENRESE